MEFLFITSLVGIAYSYAVYPALLFLLPGRKSARNVSAHSMPFVSIIIAAHNERSRIAKKIENTLAMDYPRERREVIVASDASGDGTDDVVRDYAEVTLARASERKGKEHAQALAIARARGEIIVFTDASTHIPPQAVRLLVENFSDPAVGAVSSEDRFITADGRIAGEGAYVRYEMALRRLESRKGGLVGLSGSFFAARREVCAQWDTDSPSDFNTALNCARLGYVAVSDPRVLGYYPNIKDERLEYARKVRTVTRGITGLMRHPDVLNPFAFGLFAFQVWSHKLMRWAVPWFMLLALASCGMLAATHAPYRVALGVQLVLYALALWAWVAGGGRSLLKIPYFFVQVNLAIAHATLAVLFGRRVTAWEPSRR